MKNIKLKIISLILAAIMCLSFLSACGLITKDDDVDLDRILVWVGNDDYSDVITKREYLNALFSQGSQYIQQGATIEEVMDYIYKIMVENRISIQASILGMSKDYFERGYIDQELKLSQILKKPDPKDKDAAADLVSDNLRALIEADISYEYINNIYIEAWNLSAEFEKGAIKAIVSEIMLEDNPDYEAPKPAPEKEKRPTRMKSERDREHSKWDVITSSATEEAAKKELEIQRNLTKSLKETDEFTKEFIDKFVEEFNKELIDKKDPKKDDKEIANLYDKAYKRYERQIKDAKFFTEYNDKYTERYLELLMVEKLEKACVSAYSKIVEDDAIVAKFDKTASNGKTEMHNLLLNRYTALQNQQAQRFGLDPNAYIAALEGLGEDTFLLASASGLGGYGYVKHILIEMGDKERFEWQRIGSMAISQSEKDFYRAKILDKINVKDLRDENEDKVFEWRDPSDEEEYKGFKPYGKEWTIDEFYNRKGNDGYFQTSFGANFVEKGKFSKTDIYKVSKVPAFTTPHDSELFESEAFSISEATNRFIDWIFTYNADPGMFNNKIDYIINKTPSPFLANETFMKEFAAAARDVIWAGEGAYTMIATDYGWHIVYCSMTVLENKTGSVSISDFPFNEAVMKKIENTYRKTGEETNFEDEQDPVYKIFKIIGQQLVQEVYTKEMTVWSEKYFEGIDKNFVNRNDKLFSEIFKQISR